MKMMGRPISIPNVYRANVDVAIEGVSLVKITHKPLKELIIMEYTFYPKPETLASALSVSIAAGQPAALSWAEGVVFIPVPFPPETEGLVDDYLKGKVYWSGVAFSLLPVFQPVIKVGGLEIPVIDAGINPTMRDVALWLKRRTRKEKRA